MWFKGWREQIWTSFDQKWDVIIIGGGITGAGIFNEAVKLGLRTLLLDKGDFASGTSSRSSKLVHGGFRYLKNAQINVTLQSVRERERLLHEGRGLINKLGFLMPAYKTDRIPTWMLGLGLTVYDLLAGKWSHSYYDPEEIRELCPLLTEIGLKGGYRFFDAQTDDARLVIRLIRDGVRNGGIALNYADVHDLLRDRSGNVCGVSVQDLGSICKPPDQCVQASLVINATGAWSDNLCYKMDVNPRLRKLRGSHLVFRHITLPLTRAITFLHPQDGRPVFAIPWEGATILGTTDVEHREALTTDPSISSAEVSYLLEGLNFIFPSIKLGLEDIQSAFSGIRSVLDTGKADPSKESREHVIWCDNGLLTITGGKLTTFRIMARDALRYACRMLPDKRKYTRTDKIFEHSVERSFTNDHIDPSRLQRFIGRYGAEAEIILNTARREELQNIEQTSFSLSELRWSARAEGVVHLDDILLRRLRLGILLPEGGLDRLEHFRQILQPELGWTDELWENEVLRYRTLWRSSYAPPSVAYQ